MIQRGNRRQKTFFVEDDYHAYCDLMAEWCDEYGVEVWAYCVMTNHVHLIAVPKSEEGFRRAIGEAHRRYTRRINFREKWRGHLWQGRFSSYVMDEKYLLAAARYVECNPVHARLVARPEVYRWSSAAAHIHGRDDSLVKVRPLLEIVGDWQTFLAVDDKMEEVNLIRRHENTGRPLGGDGFIKQLEVKLGRALCRRKAGRPRKEEK